MTPRKLVASEVSFTRELIDGGNWAVIARWGPFVAYEIHFGTRKIESPLYEEFCEKGLHSLNTQIQRAHAEYQVLTSVFVELGYEEPTWKVSSAPHAEGDAIQFDPFFIKAPSETEACKLICSLQRAYGGLSITKIP